MSEGEFAAAERERTGAAATFDLGGRTWTLRKRMPFGLLAQLASRAQAQGADVLDALVDLMVYAVVSDQREDFHTVLLDIPPDEDDDSVVTFQDVWNATTLIIERTTGSPFGSPSGSPGGLPTNGAMLRAPVASGATTSGEPRRVKLS